MSRQYGSQQAGEPFAKADHSDFQPKPDAAAWYAIARSGRAQLVLLVGLIVACWFYFIVLESVISYYNTEEVRFFQTASFWQIFTVMNLNEGYARFSPLAFGPIGWFDSHVLVPLLGLSDLPADKLAAARRLVWLHPPLVAASCFTVAGVVWRLLKDRRLVAVAVLMVGLSDAVPFQMRFVSTFACYGLQITAILAIYYLVRLEAVRRLRTAVLVALCVGAALAIWEQGLDLATATLAVLGVSIAAKSIPGRIGRRLPEMTAVAATLAFVAAYLVIRLRSGLAEATANNHEASYFVSYHNIFPMIDDLILNFSQLTLQSFRQFLPIPPLSLAVLSGANMNVLNPYNTYYSQYPNMFYRMMGLWYAGISFICSLGLLTYAIRLANRKRGAERQLVVAGICFFLLGFLMHLPIMHRDYFYVPGYALGYKVSISYIGFVILILLCMREVLKSPKLMALPRWQTTCLWSVAAAAFCAAAVSRAILGQVPNTFPW